MRRDVGEVHYCIYSSLGIQHRVTRRCWTQDVRNLILEILSAWWEKGTHASPQSHNPNTRGRVVTCTIAMFPSRTNVSVSSMSPPSKIVSRALCTLPATGVHRKLLTGDKTGIAKGISMLERQATPREAAC